LIQSGFDKFIKKENLNRVDYKRIDMKSLIEPIMAMLSYSFIFGRYSTEVPERVLELNRLLNELYTEGWKGLQNPFFMWFPHITRKYKLLGIFDLMERIRLRQGAILTEIMNEREQEGVEMTDCVIDRIIVHNRQMRAEGREKEALNLNQVIGAFNLMMFAGTDTTTTLINSMICAMAGDRRILEILKPLANEIFDKNGDTTYEKIESNEKLERFMKESLRLYPALGIQLDRRATKEVKLGKYTIKKDDVLNIFMFTMHRDPAVFKDPTYFDPDRFLKENEKDRPKYQYNPFAIGKRICLGRHMGNMTAKLILTQFVRNFEFTKPDDADYFMQNFTVNRVLRPVVMIKQL
jgi:cytochrome P450